MTDSRPSAAKALRGLLGLLIVVVVGAHLSYVPLFLVKCFVFVALVGFYGFFCVKTISALRIESNAPRLLLGLLLGVSTVYLTWAVRIPAFSGWETPFTLAPDMLLEAIEMRASNMTVTGAFGQGVSADGPSWLLLGTYIGEALAFIGVMFLGAMLSFPSDDSTSEAEADPEELAQAA